MERCFTNSEEINFKRFNRFLEYSSYAAITFTSFFMLYAFNYISAERENQTKRIQHIKENLAPNAVYVKEHERWIPMSQDNRDVDGDGTFEAVLEFKNPVTGTLEQRLMEMHDGRMMFRRFEVVDGKKRYLPD